jgi:hypothetical protein
MKLCDRRVLATVLAAAGTVLVAHGVVFADPPGDSCSNVCQQQGSFIESPSLECYTYTPTTCVKCVDGRCIDFVGPPLPFCVPQVEDRTRGRRYDAGCCNPSCNLILNGTSQATDPSACTVRDLVDVTRYVCDISPPPT